MQKILCKWNINPYSGCENLCIAQNFCHTRLYAARTVLVLAEADRDATAANNGAPVIRALSALALEFSRCQFGDTDTEKFAAVVSDLTDQPLQ